MNVRENWRVVLLVVLLLASGFALFVPQGSSSDAAGNFTTSDGPTNLKFGLELAGGTRIRAPVEGVTAENVQLGGTSPGDAQKQVAANLSGVTVSDVKVRATQSGATVEAFSEGVSTDDLTAALEATGLSSGDVTVREGVTEQTREEIRRTLSDKISSAGLAGGRVQTTTTPTGQHFIVVEMPNANQSRMEELVTSKGQVRLVAQFPNENGTGYRNETVLTSNQIADVGSVMQSESGETSVSVVVADSAAERFQQDMVQYGFTDEGIMSCGAAPEGQEYCLNTVVDGKTVYSAGVRGTLASDWASGSWANSPTFSVTANNLSEARNLQINLRAGALPAALDTDAGTTTYLAPTLAEQFKLYSFVAGLAAVFAVSGTVFVRYGKPEVALPMVVTALSEVVILLGFASAVGLPLDLSHIAGFIAVIGTGVDDLIIIADEVMSEGDVKSNRVFQSRFKKAFWVIGAAAVTTIIAMSPLAVLSLGDMQGFAIITILGVIIGVLVTRPAYGDILRYLLTNR